MDVAAEPGGIVQKHGGTAGKTQPGYTWVGESGAHP